MSFFVVVVISVGVEFLLCLRATMCLFVVLGR